MEQTTLLPWDAGEIEPGAVLHHGSVIFRVLSVGNSDDAERATALIVYAVNRLPAYEAAVEALDRLVTTVEMLFEGAAGDPAMVQAQWALTRLRESEAAHV